MRHFFLPAFLAVASAIAVIACSEAATSTSQPDPTNDAATPETQEPTPSESIPNTNDDAGTKGDSGPESCFVDPTPYVQAWKPPRKEHACGKEGIAAFAAACASPTSATCEAFKTQNSTCAACLFSTASDATWGIYVADPTAPGAVDGYRYNYGGCVAIAANAQCGKIFQADKECPQLACGSCAPSELADCRVKSFKAQSSCAQYSKSTALWCNAVANIDYPCDQLESAARKFCE